MVLVVDGLAAAVVGFEPVTDIVEGVTETVVNVVPAVEVNMGVVEFDEDVV